ncbi:hypothetical protein EGW08_006054 [Elysia chlorotica]|uniref:C-type lectin domain-containing protein n=1 Tax=Elysia chlorotica TaxID=188477 RepID=A0A433TX45_ELYCH|nr:hypothetical protein EGW08_006054 [Elysia chlorotica]
MQAVTLSIFLAILLVTTQAFYQPEDPRLKAIRVNYVLSTTEPLQYDCRIDITSTDFVSIDKVEVSTDALSNGDNVFDVLASVRAGELALDNYLEEEIIVEGTINEESSGTKTHIELAWKTLTGGNCLTYKCAVTGVKMDGTKETLEKEIKVRTADESPCSIKVSNTKIIRGLVPKVEECCSLASAVEQYLLDLDTVEALTDVDTSDLSAKAQTNSDQATQLLVTSESQTQNMAVAQAHSTAINELRLRTASLLLDANLFLQTRNEMLQALEDKLCNLTRRLAVAQKIALIPERFVVSEPREGKVYTLTSNVATFDIDAAKNDCEQQGGFLAEIETEDEMEFVDSFVKSNNVTDAYIGATDRVSEGFFTWVTSLVAVPTTLWHTGEPNNGADNTGSEDCVQLNVKLSDVVCNGQGKFICEIPLPVPPC